MKAQENPESEAVAVPPPLVGSPFLSTDAVKVIGEVLDGGWHLMRPNLKKASTIWELHWARILEYRYLPPIPKERHQRMEVRLHNRVRRYWANSDYTTNRSIS